VNGSRLVPDRLPPAGQVDEAQPACAERGVSIEILALIVGARMA